eukprot:TRINITY_DN26183_c0_g1_i1.p1 TRINITY_DN26183_c0_g1~~TRINITY_DN26183_c0_g1_i1.p1  ORF type:complete len:352 (-),score=70.11 TRINITY_DN26183_c0_g1_i1:370-1425(-)
MMGGMASTSLVLLLLINTQPLEGIVVGGKSLSNGVQETFESFYNKYQEGRGVWKWNNALEAYSRHFLVFQNRPCRVAEVGVQSGGSITMWHKVLGPGSFVYGIDINPATQKFADGQTEIVIGDQGDMKFWQSFHWQRTHGQGLDIVVDDGGHKPEQMLMTFVVNFPYISPGGMVSIEDIHGEHYVKDFFVPAAQYIANFAGLGGIYAIDSIHIYPFVLLVQKSGGVPNKLKFKGKEVHADSWGKMWQEAAGNRGGHVIVSNAAWGHMFQVQNLVSAFNEFGHMHAADWYDEPKGCQTTSMAVCRVIEKDSSAQALLTGIHIYPDKVVVEVADKAPVIEAVRRGMEWLEYGL